MNSIKHSLARAENLQKSLSNITKPENADQAIVNVDLPELPKTPPVIKTAKKLQLSLIESSELAESLTSSYTNQLTDIASNEQLKQELQHCQSVILKLKSQIKLANANLENSQNFSENLYLALSQEEYNRNLLTQIKDICSFRSEVCDLVLLTMESEIEFLKTGDEHSALKKSKRQRVQRDFVKNANDLRLKIINYWKGFKKFILKLQTMN